MVTAVKRFVGFLLAGSLALGLCACSGGADSSPQSTATPSQPTIIRETPSPEPSPAPSVEPSPQPSPAESEPQWPDYEFGTPLEEGELVEDTQFDNAVFLGDSRTEGLQLFSGLKHGDFYWARGMTVFRVDDPDYSIFEVNGAKRTLIGALRQKTYDAVYIMIGINELGYDAGSYEKGLSAFLDQVLEAQPEAVVYLQVLPPVNDAIARKNNLGSYINNKQVGLFNEAIVRVATEKRVVLLDTAEVYRDEDGQLIAELASDGCHFTYNGYTRWADYLRSHVMDLDRYEYWRSQTEEVVTQ